MRHAWRSAKLPFVQHVQQRRTQVMSRTGPASKPRVTAHGHEHSWPARVCSIFAGCHSPGSSAAMHRKGSLTNVASTSPYKDEATQSCPRKPLSGCTWPAFIPTCRIMGEGCCARRACQLFSPFTRTYSKIGQGCCGWPVFKLVEPFRPPAAFFRADAAWLGNDLALSWLCTARGDKPLRCQAAGDC